jgi:hypothetical protein
MLEASPQNSSQANVPRDLASAVHEELRRRSIIDPSLETLTELFDAMFFARSYCTTLRKTIMKQAI